MRPSGETFDRVVHLLTTQRLVELNKLIVVDNTITVILGAATEKQCEPDRMQADEDLKDALQQVANWRRDGDLLVLQGDRSLRFRLSSN